MVLLLIGCDPSSPENTITVEMVFVNGGTFQMGDVWDLGQSDEKPVHSVTLDDFYISKYEVSQSFYLEIMGTNPSYFVGDSLPVEQVTWYNAVEFCNKLSDTTGLEEVYTISQLGVTVDFTKNGYRLPTEAEWEYAARSGGGDDQKWSGTNNEDSLGVYAWYSLNSGDATHPVGTKKPNDLNIYDMCGNVGEWCGDWYASYSSESQTNPTGPLVGDYFYRTTRGKSWSNISTAYRCRVSYRGWSHPAYVANYCGIRLARNGD
jgi:formylglycine-generating enzyme required for sulfatase activity